MSAVMKKPAWIKREIPETVEDHARCYIDDHGWALTPILQGSKRPAPVAWQKRASTALEDWNQVFNPKLHSGPGLVHAASNTGALDIDHVESARLIFAEYGWDYDALFADYPRTVTKPGRDKIFFRLPEGFEPSSGGEVGSKWALRWPDPSGECHPDGRPKLITVFELRGGENQDVLPPSVHPDTGDPYRWADGQAPWDYTQIPILPADHPLLLIWAQWERFRAQLERISPHYQDDQPTPSVQVHVASPGKGQDVIGQYNRAVDCGEILARNNYQRRGKRWVAPNSSTKIPGVVSLKGGKVFSHHGSDILNNGHAHDAFSLLTNLEHAGNVDAALKDAALLLGIDLYPADAPEINYEAFISGTLARQAVNKDDEKPRPVAQPEPEAASMDDYFVQSAPGMLGEILRWGLATAHKPLPHITLQSALAITATIAGRRYRTDRNNWPSLWFLNIEKTASGKEHPESLIETVLEAAGLGGLIAGAGYTSPGAVFSVLLDHPSHVAIVDEFGKFMQSTQAKGNQHKADAISLLMQCWSSCHRTVRPPAYSGMGLSKEQREELSNRRVHNPAVTLYASTTPGTFYESIDRKWIADGFLGRFLTCHSPVGRQISQHAPRIDPPAAVVDWAKELGCVSIASAEDLSGMDVASDMAPAPIDVVFSAEAERLMDAVERDIHAKMDEAERWGLESLYGRTREKAMRLALLVSLAEGAGNRVITSSQAQYAIDYAVAMDSLTVEASRRHVTDSDFARVKQVCLDKIKAAGERGLTGRELERTASIFNALKPREQQDILGALANSGLIEIRTSSGRSGRGRKRQAWVALEEETTEDSGTDDQA